MRKLWILGLCLFPITSIVNAQDVDCSVSTSVYVGYYAERIESAWDKCQNREVFGLFSYLKKCPSELPLRAEGGCYACNETSVLKLLTKEDNQVCPNRAIQEGKDIDKNTLYFESILSEECPTDNVLRTKRSGCQSCESDRCWELFSKQDNDVCLNRKILDIKNRGIYSCPRCPEDKLLVGGMVAGQLICASCDDERTFALFSREDNDVCPNRELLDFKGCGRLYSRIRKCPEEKPLQTFHAGCKACNDPGEYELLRKSDNEVCPNRVTRPVPNAVYSECIGEQPSNLISYLPQNKDEK